MRRPVSRDANSGGTTRLMPSSCRTTAILFLGRKRAMAIEATKAPQSVLQYRGKNFDASAVETFLYDWWKASGFFTPPPEQPGETPFVMMLPLPNVTGDLHLGHALGFGGYEDLMARWHRMRGEPTLWLPGTDHAGIIAHI